MVYYIDSAMLIADFLRSNLTDPRGRVQLDSNYSQTLDGSTRVISINGVDNISHIANVQIDGSSLTKYKDWVYDYNNRNLVLSQTQTGELTYDVYVGTNWIYHDRPRTDMKPNQFPRITVSTVSSPSPVLGNDKAKIVTSYRFQVNTYCKSNSFFTTDVGLSTNVEMSGQELANKINDDIINVFRDSRDDLHPIFANYTLQVRKAVEPYDTSIQAYNTRQEFSMLKIKEVQ
jgi:hypothetical protein